MRKLLIVAMLISTGAFALESPVNVTRQEIHRVEGAKAPKLSGKPVSNDNGNSKKEIIEIQNIKQETIYQFPENKAQMNFNVVTAIPISSAYRQKNKSETTTQKGSNVVRTQSTETKRIYKGYCDIPDVTVSIERKYIHTECVVLNDNPRIQRATIELIPEIQEYRLNGKVVKMNGQPVTSIKVLSPDRSTDNIAEDVNRQLISNILLQVAQQTGQEVSQTTQGIFQNAGNSVASNGTNTYINSTVPNAGVNVQQELNQIPKEAEYLAIANLIGASANELLDGQKQLPPIFTPYKQVFVEFEK